MKLYRIGLKPTEKLSIITNKRLLRHRRIHVKILLRKVFVAGLRKESGCVFYVKARHFESCTARNLKITKHSQRKEREKGKMLKKLMKKEEGFTLAELLIVVAIIAVLVAISIPIFTTQLEKSREATDISNVRSAYAEVVTAYLTGESTSNMTVDAKQTVADWQGPSGIIEYFIDGSTKEYSYTAGKAPQKYTVGITVDSATGNATPTVTVA